AVSVPVGAPDNELCQLATGLVADLSPVFLFNHCARSFLFADAIGKRDGLQYDRELLYLSAMLHDLGLTDSYLDGNQRFELEGADRARAFLVERGLDEKKADVVWDAIALNSSFGIALRKGPETALTFLGVSADFLGTRLPDVGPERVEQIVSEYPRLDLISSATDLLVKCARRKPQFVPGTFLEVVVHSHAPDLRVPTWADLLAQSPWKE
ncbi:MAG TPA: HD domain-containing protein, partial [Thermoanaerobaculia bacterium]